MFEKNTYMAIHMTQELFERLRHRKTSTGFDLQRAIHPGLHAPKSDHWPRTGLVAGDEETYGCFRELFDRVIEDRQGVSTHVIRQAFDLDPTKLEVISFNPEYVTSVRIRTARNIRGFRLPPHCTRQERLQIERLAIDTVDRLSGELSGEYHTLGQLDEGQRETWVREHLLFCHPGAADPRLLARDWPEGRGIYMNPSRSFLVWVNEEDHLRLISMQPGGDLLAAFSRFCEGVRRFESAAHALGHQFMQNDRWGHLSTCPSNVGTALRASVLIRLPRLIGSGTLHRRAQDMGLEVRGVDGEDGGITETSCEISNRFRWGRTEVELVNMLAKGVEELIRQEQALSVLAP